MTDVNEASEEDDGQGCAIVFEKFSHISLEEVAVAQLATNPTGHQYEECHHDGQIGRGLSNGTPLAGQDLNAFLEVNEGDIESEDIA